MVAHECTCERRVVDGGLHSGDVVGLRERGGKDQWKHENTARENRKTVSTMMMRERANVIHTVMIARKHDCERRAVDGGQHSGDTACLGDGQY